MSGLHWREGQGIYFSKIGQLSKNSSLVVRLDIQAVATSPWGTVSLTSSLASTAISMLLTE